VDGFGGDGLGKGDGFEEGDGLVEGDGLRTEMGWERRWDREGDGFGADMVCMREMADALWDGHALLKTELSVHRHTHRQTQSHTKVKTVYPPVSFRSLGGCNKFTLPYFDFATVCSRVHGCSL